MFQNAVNQITNWHQLAKKTSRANMSSEQITFLTCLCNIINSLNHSASFQKAKSDTEQARRHTRFNHNFILFVT
jgi:uncharacterized protein (DUF1919 family)